MEKEFIPYKEALALKELGFDEKCFGKYFYIKEHEVYDPRKREDFMFGDNNRIILRDTPHNYGYDPNEITVCSAPLYQQSIKYLYICSDGKIDIHIKGSDTHEKLNRKLKQGIQDLRDLQNNKSK